MSEKKADNNRFVFVSFRNICMCVSFWYFCVCVCVSVADISVYLFVVAIFSLYCSASYSLSHICLFVYVDFFPVLLKCHKCSQFVCARHQNYEMPTINILLLKRTREKTEKEKWIEKDRAYMKKKTTAKERCHGYKLVFVSYLFQHFSMLQPNV